MKGVFPRYPLVILAVFWLTGPGIFSGVEPLEGNFESAVLERNWEKLAAMLENGADPNARSSWAGNPLWWELLNEGHHDAAELFLRAGANVQALDGAGSRPVDRALQIGNLRMARFLAQHGAKPSLTAWEAMRKGEPAVLQFVLAHRNFPESSPLDGMSPLAYAIRHGDVNSTALLMHYGGRPNLSERVEGHSLFEWAIATKKGPIAEQLVLLGANVNEEVRQPVAEAFVDQFESKNIRYSLTQDRGVTPIMLVASSGQHDLARFLLDRGAKKNATTDRYGTWPINYATHVNDVAMTQIMLGRDPDRGSQDRKVVIDLSAQRAVLYENGEAKISSRVSTGKSGYRTPKGTYVITNKHRHWNSTIYGSSMPYFLRLSCGAFGLHQGYVPNYPASHGCIRVPSSYARKFFYATELGDVVVIK